MKNGTEFKYVILYEIRAFPFAPINASFIIIIFQSVLSCCINCH